MERDHRAPYNPYHNMFESPGREVFAGLFNAELNFMVPQSYSNDEDHKSLRKYAAQVIQKHSPCFDFDALIPYTAMTYFDRVVSRGDYLPHVDTSSAEKNTVLFVICCLTIAWKLRDETFRLSSFLRERNLEYSTQDVLSMELQICRRLEWRMRTVTPFCFVEFFFPVLRLPPNLPSPRRPIRELIVRSQFDIAFTAFRSSVMAASAMITVTSKMFPAHYSFFEPNILAHELLRPLKKNIQKCKKELAPLYRNPTIPEEEMRANTRGTQSTR